MGNPIPMDGNHFNRSLDRQGQSDKRLTPDELIRISKTPLFSRAIELISNGVAAMPWVINLPREKLEDEEAKKTAERIEKSMNQPNVDFESQDIYTNFMKAVVRDLLIFNSVGIERKPGFDKNFQSFWLWARPIEWVHKDPRWLAAYEGVYPRYWYHDPRWGKQDWVPLYNEDFFIISHRSSTREDVAPSPIELAYKDVCTWLSLREFQSDTVEKAFRDFMILLSETDENGVEAFREKWENDVVGKGDILIASANVDIKKFGPKNDEELYPGQAEFLAQIIAMEFGLLKRDYGYYQDANYATANIADQTSFQQGIRPVADVIIQHLDAKAIKYYHEGFSITLADRNPQKELDEAKRSRELYDGGIMYQNEAREANGLSPVPGGERFSDGHSSTEDEEELLIEEEIPEEEEIVEDEIVDKGDGKKSSVVKLPQKPKETKKVVKKKKAVAASRQPKIIQLSLF